MERKKKIVDKKRSLIAIAFENNVTLQVGNPKLLLKILV